MDYWKIVAFAGSVIFLFSGFLPMITVAVFGVSRTLFDMYASLPIDLYTVRYLPTFVLYPITLILGFISTVKRKIAIVAGMLGLVCWIDYIVALSQYHRTELAGTGVYVGIVGAIIIAGAYFLKPSPAPAPQPLTSPPPSPVTPSG